MKDLSVDPSIDPTIPDKAEFVAGGKHAGLEEDLDGLAKGLTGTPEKQRSTFFDRILALAKRRDLRFADVHSLALTRHPELRSNETLEPMPFAPGLLTRTETAQKLREQDQLLKEIERKKQQKVSSAMGRLMAKVEAIQAGDHSIAFVDAWNAVLQENPSLQDYGDVSQVKPPVAQPKRPQVVMPRPAKAPLPDVVYGEDPPLNLPPGTVLVYAVDDGRES
jgi:hypothetical protein